MWTCLNRKMFITVLILLTLCAVVYFHVANPSGIVLLSDTLRLFCVSQFCLFLCFSVSVLQPRNSRPNDWRRSTSSLHNTDISVMAEVVNKNIKKMFILMCPVYCRWVAYCILIFSWESSYCVVVYILSHSRRRGGQAKSPKEISSNCGPCHSGDTSDFTPSNLFWIGSKGIQPSLDRCRVIHGCFNQCWGIMVDLNRLKRKVSWASWNY